MNYLECKICKHKEYYQSKSNLFTDARMYNVNDRLVICSDCLNKGVNK
jgi:hypothetical protein